MSPAAGSTAGRGYGSHHRRLRARWATLVAAGSVTCARCDEPIQRGQAWDLGHTPGSGKTLYAGPMHAACNRDTRFERQATDPDPGPPRTRW